jgi:hypothetical protein
MKVESVEGRCVVCALPLPVKAEDAICSRRCAGMRRRALVVAGREREHWKSAILKSLGGLGDGTTICPGALARELLPKDSHPLALLRPLIFELQEERRVVLSQSGCAIIWRKVRGPFRIRLR